jgi:leucyl aminopeptidase
MVSCFSRTSKTTPIYLLSEKQFKPWLTKQDVFTKHWLKANAFVGKSDTVQCIPSTTGGISSVIWLFDPLNASLEQRASIVSQLPAGHYRYVDCDPETHRALALAWGRACYRFTRYKKAGPCKHHLYLPPSIRQQVAPMLEAICSVRDWVNTPAEDMNPAALATLVRRIAKKASATVHVIQGEALKKGYPAIYAVGRAAKDAPRLIDLRWGKKKDPLLTLVGKGVCFDTGGLDIKISPHMRLMKKDMGGAAHVLSLASLIMHFKLPVRLRVLIPAVENAIGPRSYRPGDVINTRKGLSVEIGNTDAEGRLVLADALTEAMRESPDLVIDFATLTGAARVALGTDLPAMFASSAHIANDVAAISQTIDDPVWPMPLHKPYQALLKSDIADLNNCASSSYGGAITAALFLNHFVDEARDWLHFDVMAWNLSSTPGRPKGGEAMGLQAVYHYLVKRYARNKR